MADFRWFEDLYSKLKPEENMSQMASLEPQNMSVMSDSPVSQSMGMPRPKPSPIQAPSLIAEETITEGPQMRPDVVDHLVKQNPGRFGIEARQKIMDQNAEDASGVDFGSALAALGAGFQGQNAAQAGMAHKKMNADARNQKLVDFDKGRDAEIADKKFVRDEELLARESDPNSLESQSARELAKKIGMKNVEGLTAEKWKSLGDVPLKMYQIDENARNAKESRDERRFLAGQTLQDRRDARLEKRDEKQSAVDAKKSESVRDVEDRRRNIEDNLALVEQQIKDKGTYEAFGSHNEDLNRRVDMIATDMAKLADPTSVARPQEVEMFKKGLVEAGATNMTNATALNLIKNFRAEVGKRADNAYKIRGLDNPGAQAERMGGENGEKTVVKKQRSPSTGKTKITYSDGSEEIQ